MLAATQTSTFTLYGILYHLIANPDIMQKVRTEFKDVKKNNDDWLESLSYDNIGQLTYLGMVVNETLRLDPPSFISSNLKLIEPMEVCGYKFRPDVPFSIYMKALHRNPKEWQQPTKFIPERFDPKSPYYLTPSGKRRH